jgi:photosystem II stability/assembly factor-like uncharacterized protein
MRTLITLIIAGLTLQGAAQHYTWTPQVSGTSQWLNDITFTNLMHGCAVGTNGVIISTDDGGETWNTQISGTTEELHSVFFLNQDTGWAAGGATQPVLLHTTDGGMNWTPVDTEFPGALLLRGIEFADAENGYAISTDGIFRTADGGLTWKEDSYSSLVISILYLGELTVRTASSAYACGYYRNKSNETLPVVFENMSLQQGQWLPQSSGGFDPQDSLTTLFFTESGTGFAGSTTGKVYRQKEDGGTFPIPWTLNFDAGGKGVQSIVFPSESHGMVSVTGEENGHEVQFIYHTADTGSTWSTDPEMLPDMVTGTLTAPDVNHAWIAGSNGKIYQGTRNDPLSVTSVKPVTLTVMPNPFTAQLTIEPSASLHEARYELLDLTGKVVRSGQIAGEVRRFTLNGLSELHQGIYILRVSSAGDIPVTTRKIVKY